MQFLRRIALFYIASNHRKFHNKRIVLTCSHFDCVRAWAEVSLQCRWVCPWTTTQSATWQEGGSTPPPTQHPGPRHISLISCSYQLQQQEVVVEELWAPEAITWQPLQPRLTADTSQHQVQGPPQEMGEWASNIYDGFSWHIYTYIYLLIYMWVFGLGFSQCYRSRSRKLDLPLSVGLTLIGNTINWLPWIMKGYLSSKYK